MTLQRFWPRSSWVNPPLGTGQPAWRDTVGVVCVVWFSLREIGNPHSQTQTGEGATLLSLSSLGGFLGFFSYAPELGWELQNFPFGEKNQAFPLNIGFDEPLVFAGTQWSSVKLTESFSKFSRLL